MEWDMRKFGLIGINGIRIPGHFYSMRILYV